MPAFNEEKSIEHVLPALNDALEHIHFELIFIDDGSSDATYEKITELTKIANNVRGFRFSRNFGKEAAIWAGLENAKGDCCVVMDCDLQHPPQVIPELYKLWQQGYEVVEGVKKIKDDKPFTYGIFSNLFYRIITFLSGFNMRASSDFKLLDKRVVNALLTLEERNTFFRGLSFWVGFRSIKFEYDVMPRKFGATKWNFYKLTKYALNNIAGFSTAPMQLVTLLGTILIVFSVIIGIQTLIRFFMGHALEGFTTIILLLLLIGGCLMVSIGVVGLYIAKIYEEIKKRPRFIVSETTEDEETKEF
jgi:dolichol-phosphate mannosyltransferase